MRTMIQAFVPAGNCGSISAGPEVAFLQSTSSMRESRSGVTIRFLLPQRLFTPCFFMSSLCG